MPLDSSWHFVTMDEVKDNVPAHYPITGLCIITEKRNCPQGYEVIERTYDDNVDADLWKDGFFGRRILRYLAVTRHYPLDGGRLNNVLADIAITADRSTAPPGYSTVDLTVDTRENAMKKKQLIVKMLPRNATSSAVCEIIILSKMRRPPNGYTIAGEDLNNMCICFKYGPVPAEKQEQSQSLAEANLPYTLNPAGYLQQHRQGAAPPSPAVVEDANRPAGWGQTGSRNPLKRMDTVLAKHYSNVAAKTPIQGIPFEINPKLQGNSTDFNIHQLPFMSLADIESKYHYDFSIERTVFSYIDGEA